jgi:hypothetical protein
MDLLRGLTDRRRMLYSKMSIRWRTTISCLLLMGCLCVASCGAGQPGKTYGLLSWRQGERETIVMVGTFQAVLTPQGACAWLGPGPDYPTLWPQGYAVRFHPTQLIGPKRRIVGRAGQKLGFYATLVSVRKGSSGLTGPARCGVVANKVAVLESPS